MSAPLFSSDRCNTRNALFFFRHHSLAEIKKKNVFISADRLERAVSSIYIVRNLRYAGFPLCELNSSSWHRELNVLNMPRFKYQLFLRSVIHVFQCFFWELSATSSPFVVEDLLLLSKCIDVVHAKCKAEIKYWLSRAFSSHARYYFRWTKLRKPQYISL